MAMNVANKFGVINAEGIWMKHMQECSTLQDELEVK
jgi:predicted outer membrane lipoprotein